eukprot:5399516-Prymnesium_polylepis.1
MAPARMPSASTVSKAACGWRSTGASIMASNVVRVELRGRDFNARWQIEVPQPVTLRTLGSDTGE